MRQDRRDDGLSTRRDRDRCPAAINAADNPHEITLDELFDEADGCRMRQPNDRRQGLDRLAGIAGNGDEGGGFRRPGIGIRDIPHRQGVFDQDTEDVEKIGAARAAAGLGHGQV